VRAGEGTDFAVVVFRDQGQWQAEMMPQRLTEDLDGLLAVLHQQPADGGAIGLVNVADEFFVAIRVGAGGDRLLLSDVTAAVAWDLARQVTERLGVSVPADEDDVAEVWPAGDLGSSPISAWTRWCSAQCCPIWMPTPTNNFWSLPSDWVSQNRTSG
jgi:hypothetical protein